MGTEIFWRLLGSGSHHGDVRPPPLPLFLLLMLLGLFSSPHSAAGFQLTPTSADDTRPLTVEADNGIEWDRHNRTLVARGHAMAERGEITVKADILRAYYREPDGGQPDVWQLEAEGNVIIRSPRETAYADHAVYNRDDAKMTLTGNNLRLETENGVLTARDALEYWELKGIAVAQGNAKVRQGVRHLEAERLITHFRQGADGQLTADRVEGQGRVTIRTTEEVATADEGVYYVDKERAILVGNVKITRGTSQLNGDQAEIDLKTGISRLTTRSRGRRQQRVRGLLVPPPGK